MFKVFIYKIPIIFDAHFMVDIEIKSIGPQAR
jgi:hypothetical protein